MHANFAAVQTMAALIFLPSSVGSKLDHQSHQNLGSNLYLILPERNIGQIAFTSGWLCHHELRNPCATCPCPLEQNSGDATDFRDNFYRSCDQSNSVKALKETSWSSRSGLNPIRTTQPCYNNTTLGSHLYTQR